MKPTEDVMNKFYQHIGQLFYAVASADKIVRKDEIEKLKEIVRKEWLPLDNATDKFGTDAAYQIEIVFEWLTDRETNSEDSFKKFSTYYTEHSYLFADTYKKTIAQTAASIADAYHGKNKSELHILSELNTLMKK